jgi:general secretion pathway protein D
VILVPDKRTNIIIVLASQTGTERVKQLIKMLDKDAPKGNESIHVYYLENAKAEDLAKVLQEFPTKQQGSTDKGKQMAPVLSENVKITADKATNSLIIVAEKDDYETLKEIIKKLDMLRAMLYIECLLMEVNKDESLNLGTEWMVGGNASYGDKSGVWGSGFSGGATGGDAGYLQTAMAASSGQASLLPPGFSMGVFGEAIQVGSVVFPNIAAVISAYKKDRSANILSTPQILTTENEKAKIHVGKNVPYLTKASSGDTNYSNYEYKDVGISLEVTPQINKDRQIRLEIALEATKLESTTDLFQPTTLKRTINTVVVVNDANTVVIGGLIDDALSSVDYKVPCLGSIPIVGWLFRSMGRGAEQTNLYVFLTPHVLENREEIDAIYNSKKIHIQAIEEGNIKLFKEEDKVTLPNLIMNE